MLHTDPKESKDLGPEKTQSKDLDSEKIQSDAAKLNIGKIKQQSEKIKSKFENLKSQSPQELFQKIRLKIKEKGPLFFVLYTGFSFIDLGLLFFLVNSNLDLSYLLSIFGLHQESTWVGSFAIAYAIHKALLPIRAFLVIEAIPYVKEPWEKLLLRIRNKNKK